MAEPDEYGEMRRCFQCGRMADVMDFQQCKRCGRSLCETCVVYSGQVCADCQTVALKGELT